jgi:peptidoglycan/LPS O-acetylase OafA/YrhL
MLARLLEARPLVVAGLVSYGVFLWHEPLVLALRDDGLTLSGTDGFLVNLGVLTLVTGIASWATYRWVELPALRRRTPRGRWRRERTPLPAAQAEAAP